MSVFNDGEREFLAEAAGDLRHDMKHLASYARWLRDQELKLSPADNASHESFAHRAKVLLAQLDRFVKDEATHAGKHPVAKFSAEEADVIKRAHRIITSAAADWASIEVVHPTKKKRKKK
jgi:hypothetical protein